MNVKKTKMRLGKTFLMRTLLVFFSLFLLMSCLTQPDKSAMAIMSKCGFQVLLPENIYSGSDTIIYKSDRIISYMWKGVSRTAENKNVFYNVSATTYPPKMIHSDSLGLVQVLFTDREPAYFMNNQYELLERSDIFRFGYPGARFVWLNKEDNSRIYNHYYMVKNRLYYLSIVLPVYNKEMIKMKDDFVNSFYLTDHPK
ncbi:MAG: hypothetical protein ACRC9Q_09695 [Bacteroidales bacterium]